MPNEYEKVQAAATSLRRNLEWETPPRVGLVLGSGLGGVTGELRLTGLRQVSYSEIPGWPAGAVPGHAGFAAYGKADGAPALALAGRVHLYEGRTPAEVVFGVRVLAALGIHWLVLTNAAGAIREGWRPGRLALIADHLNLQGASPLSGPHAERFGPRFVDLSQAYSPLARRKARQAAGDLGMELYEGVYAGVFGPQFETPAEVRALRTLGADMAGMSTVLETIAARQAGLEVLGISVLTNLAAGLGTQELSHEEVMEAGSRVQARLAALLRELIPRMHAECA